MPQPSLEYVIQHFGREKEPIVIIENFSGQLEYLRGASTSIKYHSAGPGYPGLRAPADTRYLMDKGRLLSDAMRDAFGFNGDASIESSSFSIVSTPQNKLRPAQCIPHYDDTSPNLLAAMHYLCDEETGGTSFYRHKSTGFETITPERVTAYRSAMRKDDATYGMPDQRYIYGDSERFEMIGDIDAKPDRLIIYRGRTLHSGSIRKTFIPTTDPVKGRVTINSFLVGLS